jgi:hypothetical protein
MNGSENELIGYWSSESEFGSTVYIRFTEDGLLQWGYENEWRICNISHNYRIENETLATICPPNPRKEFTPYTISPDGVLKFIYTNRETIWKRAEKQAFFDSENIWDPGILFGRQIDYMALLGQPPHPFQIKRADYLKISPQTIVNTHALWNAWEYSMAEFASLHLDDFKFILEQGVLIDEDDNMDTTLLSHLAADGHIEAVRLLLDNGADINHINILSATALDSAIWTNQSETIKLLRERGAKTGEELRDMPTA